MIRVSRRKTIKKLIKPENGCIGDQHLTEQLDLQHGRVGNRDLLESVLEEVAQQGPKCWCEPVVETGASNSLVGRCGVGPLKSGDRAGFAIDGEAHNSVQTSIVMSIVRWR